MQKAHECHGIFGVDNSLGCVKDHSIGIFIITSVLALQEMVFSALVFGVNLYKFYRMNIVLSETSKQIQNFNDLR